MDYESPSKRGHAFEYETFYDAYAAHLEVLEHIKAENADLYHTILAQMFKSARQVYFCRLLLDFNYLIQFYVARGRFLAVMRNAGILLTVL